jgi:hypothetical protein
MGQRSDLQSLLVTLGTPHVYFQAPPSYGMNYPCIIYRLDTRQVEHANNLPYKHDKRYQVTVIDEDPDSEIPDMVAELPKCRFERFYVADNLNHNVFQLFF